MKTQEETKQDFDKSKYVSGIDPIVEETLEEVAERYSKKSTESVFQEAHKQDFIAGARWQQEQAKEMEKKRIKDAYLNGRYDADKIVMSDNFYAEQYYNETFKQEQ